MKLGHGLEGALFALAGLCFFVSTDWIVKLPGPFEVGRRTTGTVRLMTWNVGSPGSPGGSALRDENLSAVAASIGVARPDLCFLQEVASRGQLDELCLLLGPGWNALISTSGTRRVAALSHSGELERIALPVRHSRSVAVRYTGTHGRREFLGLGLHADAWSSSKRNAGIGGLSQALEAHSSAAVKVFAGDFNLDIDKRGDLFSDDAHLDLETYNYVAAHWSDVGQGTGPTAEPDRRLDYIFVQEEGVEVLQAGPWPDRRAGEMDHDPLLVDLRFR
ncbi:MAG: endonuclease/exonuclease/phosphatase family metal-dependent hydrolase [Planctomycetota bacterium]|jgi:endonuclease/exonuclease/phosphatase family metal-dependent hydrolase